MAEDRDVVAGKGDSGLGKGEEELFADHRYIIEDNHGNGGWVIVVLMLFAALLIGIFFLNGEDGVDKPAAEEDAALIAGRLAHRLA